MERVLGKPFRKWVTAEVLPAIRRTGRYEAPRVSVEKILPSTGITAVIMAREFKASKEIAELCGLSGNPALISANNAVKTMYGAAADPLAVIGVQLESPSKTRLLTPTEIGRQLEPPLSAIAVRLLQERGLQLCRPDAHGDKVWEMTEAGREFGVLIDSGKRHKTDGSMIRQLKWEAGVVALLKTAGSDEIEPAEPVSPAPVDGSDDPGTFIGTETVFGFDMPPNRHAF